MILRQGFHAMRSNYSSLVLVIPTFALKKLTYILLLQVQEVESLLKNVAEEILPGVSRTDSIEDIPVLQLCPDMHFT